MKTVIFVHGFGVRADSRGMFTDIVNYLPISDYKCVLFDLNDIIDDDNLTIPPFSKQVARLQQIYKEHESENVSIIAHSQGCIVTAIASIPNIKKTILLAPPTDTNITKTVEYFKQNPLSVINIDDTSKLARRDGSFTFVPKEYWEERKSLNLAEIYKNYVAAHDVLVVQATRDDVISNEHFTNMFNGVPTTSIEADHDFTNQSRQTLLAVCSEALSEI